MPNNPDRRQTRTASRVRRENRFGVRGRYRSSNACRAAPAYVITTTLSIIPSTVQAAVSSQERPKAKPDSGPPTNLIVLAMITEAYRANCMKFYLVL